MKARLFRSARARMSRYASPWSLWSARAGRRAVLGCVALALLGGVAFQPAPAYASGTTDLSIKLSRPNNTAPGKRVSYTVIVHNKGPVSATKVQIDFMTSAAMGSITYAITSGHCYRSPHETACLFGNLRVGQTGTATISGLMSKKIKKGTLVTNRVSLASNTHLSNPANNQAGDSYHVGVPRSVAIRTPAPSPGTSPPTTPTTLTAITDTASRWIGYSQVAGVVTLVVVAVAIAWFVIGLTLRRQPRRRQR